MRNFGRRGDSYGDVDLCQFGSGSQRTVEIFGSCFHDSPSHGLCSGRGCFGRQGGSIGTAAEKRGQLSYVKVSTNGGIVSEARDPRARLFQLGNPAFPQLFSPAPPQFGSLVLPSSSFSPSSRQSSPLRHPRPLSSFPGAPSPSPQHGHHYRYRTTALAFIAAVTADFHEWNASFTNSEFHLKRVKCVW